MDDRKLTILWTSDNEETAHLMVMMYATNSMLNGWWDSVTVVLWGAAQKLAAENDVVQDSINTARHAGVDFEACKSCAMQLGVQEDLESMGIEVKNWGQPLTEILQGDGKLLTV